MDFKITECFIYNINNTPKLVASLMKTNMHDLMAFFFKSASIWILY